MEGRSYTNFDLVIEPAGDRYRARVISSPAGQAAVEFVSLFSPLELENFVLRMGRPQRGMRRIESPEMETIKAFGARLFETVFSDEIYACYLRSMDHVLDQNRGLRIRLRINVPEFHDLPWEYLYNPQFDQFLALSRDTPIVRYVELPYGTQALPVKAPMKILVMIASPTEYPPLKVQEEWDRLNGALQPLIDRGLVLLKKLQRATLSALQQEMRREPVHVFHYIGHGKYFERQQDGMLLLEDEEHHGRPTSGQQLGAILHDHHTLRLAVLNACEGARTSAKDPYTGVAQTLVRQGIPAVLAMQFEIFESAAITLAQEFYGAIADGYPVDAALSEARKAIFAADNDVEWGTPVLFMRVPNGVLFKPQKPAGSKSEAGDPGTETAQREEEAPERRALVAELYEQARRKMIEKDWAHACQLFEQIDQTEPGFIDVRELLKQAQAQRDRQQRFAGLLARGKEHIARCEWMRAVGTLEEAVILDPENAEAKALLSRAEQAMKVEALFDAAQQNLLDKQLPEAILKFQTILELDPGHTEARAQLTKASIELAHQMKEIKRSEPTSFAEVLKPRPKPRDLPR